MWRALLKGTVLAGIGHLPKGPDAYRWLTRQRLGTQATHVDKLCRVLPGYLRAWREVAGVRLAGARLWIHEPGWTPFWALAGYLLTGRGAALTNAEARMLARYLDRALSGALQVDLPGLPGLAQRRARLVDLRERGAGLSEVLSALDARLSEGVEPGAIALEDGSIDLVHSGGALEHLKPEELDRFLAESHRILAPGGLASHVFDHRDHLHHADGDWPFLGHLALPGWAYAAWCGHPLGYHNRLAPGQVARRFERAGFVPLAVRRLVLPAGRYVDPSAVMRARPGLARGYLAAEHRRIDDLDLRTAAAHYLYVKPGGSSG